MIIRLLVPPLRQVFVAEQSVVVAAGVVSWRLESRSVLVAIVGSKLTQG